MGRVGAQRVREIAVPDDPAEFVGAIKSAEEPTFGRPGSCPILKNWQTHEVQILAGLT